MKVPSAAAVGQAIRALRERKHQSLTAVSRTASISSAELAAIESGRGRATVAQLHRVARAVGSSLVDVVNDARMPASTNGAGMRSKASSIGLPEIARAIAELPGSLGSKVDAAESAAVLYAMQVEGNNQSAAARLLGMERKAFVRRLARTRRKSKKRK